MSDTQHYEIYCRTELTAKAVTKEISRKAMKKISTHEQMQCSCPWPDNTHTTHYKNVVLMLSPHLPHLSRFPQIGSVFVAYRCRKLQQHHFATP